jgi:phosphatidylserine synthase
MTAPLLRRSFPRRLHLANIPNTASTLGLATAVVWLMGGGPEFAIASIVLDEIDGTLARVLNQKSGFGAEYDSAIDMCLQGAVAMKLGAPWLLLFTVPYSVYEKTKDKKPMFGSWRAMGMTYAVLKGI